MHPCFVHFFIAHIVVRILLTVGKLVDALCMTVSLEININSEPVTDSKDCLRTSKRIVNFVRGVELWSSSFGHVARKSKPIVEELIQNIGK